MLSRITRRLCTLALLVLLPQVSASDDAALTRTFEAHGSTLQLVLSEDFKPPIRHNVTRWVDFLSGALLQVYDRWPQQHWQITVAPASATASDPIPWAQVHRGATDSVEFHVSHLASADQLISAWTGYHELAHLLIPYRGWGDTWFSEGLASYYQNILQARTGLLSEQEMWQNFYNAFQRGRADNAYDDKPLSIVSDDMRSNGGFMRVYWSGAWYFLALDTRLRRQSGGASSLDSALEKLNRCCAKQSLSVPEMVRTLDELNKVLMFQTLYEKTRQSKQVPPFENIFASLGITVVNDMVTLQQEGPGARLRQQISQPRAL